MSMKKLLITERRRDMLSVGCNSSKRLISETQLAIQARPGHIHATLVSQKSGAKGDETGARATCLLCKQQKRTFA